MIYAWAEVPQEAREEAQMHFPNHTITEHDVPHEDYDNFDMLNKLFQALAPHGWQDSTWKNDTCPSLYKEEKHGNACRIFVDYADPDKREYHHWSVLSYNCYDAEGMLTFQESFDNVDKLIIYLTKRVN